MSAALFWSAIAGFLIGVFFRSFVPLGFAFIGCLALVAVCVLVAARGKGVVVAALLFAAALGVLRMHAAVPPPDLPLERSLGQSVALEGVVFREPDVRENSIRLAVSADSLETETGETVAVDSGVLALVPLHASVRYGDRVRAEGVLRAPEAFEGGGGREFNYPGYLASQGVRYELAFASVERIEERASFVGEGNVVKAGAIALKQAYISGLALVLPEPQGGLAGGITVGDKRGLGPELSDVFKIVGLTHIVVLSGYNIMVVVDALLRLLAGTPRALQVGAGGSVAALFALMTGLASASVRAAAMAMIALLGRASGRIYLASRALGLVACLMLVWNPYLLAFDPGFQLSVVATWGLIALSPLFERTLWFMPARFGFREVAIASLSAQTAVLPLILYQTGLLSLAALPANLLILPVVPLAMAASAVAGLGGLVLGSLAVPLALPAHALLSYIITVSEFLAGLPLAATPVPAFGGAILILLYALLLAAVVMLRQRLRLADGQTALPIHASSDS